MEELSKKLSSYNLFINLLPGALFVVLAEYITEYSFQGENLIVSFFLYYFVGLTISRFGSLVIEPLLIKTKFLQREDYEKYLIAEVKDEKLSEISEGNNVYRSLTSLFILLYLIKGYGFLAAKYNWLDVYSGTILLTLLFILFLCSYRKQNAYTVQRIRKHN